MKRYLWTVVAALALAPLAGAQEQAPVRLRPLPRGASRPAPSRS